MDFGSFLAVPEIKIKVITYRDIFQDKAMIENRFGEEYKALSAVIKLDPADLKHFRRPLPVFHIQKEHPGSVRDIGGKGPRQHVDQIILRQHDLADRREFFRLVLPHPQELRGGEAREGDVARIVGKLFLSDFIVQIFRFFLRSSVIPQNGGADDPVVFIQSDQTVHLTADADSSDLTFIRRFRAEQFFKTRKILAEPILRILLRPS